MSSYWGKEIPSRSRRRVSMGEPVGRCVKSVSHLRPSVSTSNIVALEVQKLRLPVSTIVAHPLIRLRRLASSVADLTPLTFSELTDIEGTHSRVLVASVECGAAVSRGLTSRILDFVASSDAAGKASS